MTIWCKSYNCLDCIGGLTSIRIESWKFWFCNFCPVSSQEMQMVNNGEEFWQKELGSSLAGWFVAQFRSNFIGYLAICCTRQSQSHPSSICPTRLTSRGI